MKYLFCLTILSLSLHYACTPGSGPRPIPPCKTAALCSELITRQESKCDNNPFTDKSFYVRNDHPSEKVVVLIERYEQKMDINYPDGKQSFVSSDIKILKGKQEAYLGCEFEKYLIGGDNEWLKNIYVIKKACFFDDDGCRVNDPGDEPEPRPVSCAQACGDPNSEFCVTEEICGEPNVRWLNNELYELYRRLETANLAFDQIDLSLLAPQLIGYCGTRDMNITARSILIQGSTCTFYFPTNHPTVKGVWLRLPSLITGRISVNSGDVVLQFKDDHESPILIYEIEDPATGVTVNKQELVDKLNLTSRTFAIEGKTSRCFNFDYCYQGEG